MVTAGGGRGNGLDAVGWDAIMDGLAGATAVKSLNGVGGLWGLEKLFQGGQAEVNLERQELEEKEAATAVGRLLRRSEATLRKLSLPWVAPSLVRAVG